MVLLNANPSEDINHTKDIHLVIKNGSVVDRDNLKLPVNEQRSNSGAPEESGSRL